MAGGKPKPKVQAIDPPPPAEDDPWAEGGMQLQAAAKFSGQSVRTLRKRMADGTLVWSRPTGRRLIAKRSLLRWMTGRAGGG